MKDWVQLLTAIIQSFTALLILIQGRKKKKKGTKRRGRRNR
ncbi:hypothetical protein P4K96_16780 [Bacillus cereus]|nr:MULTISPECIES: hypothetical protein [Paenibacillus]MEB9895146.1 hypothetical protein [Bacillus cereus]